MLQFSVDEEKCVSCGMCVKDCLHGALAMGENVPYMARPNHCLRCQHCLAVCPAGALSVLERGPARSLPLAGHLPEASTLETLIKGRRSIRNYARRDVDAAVLREILDIAWHAPTGGNAQKLLLTVVDTCQAMDALREHVYHRIGEMVREERLPDCSFPGFFRQAPQRWAEFGEDGVFRGAPHCLIVSNAADATSVAEDPLIYLSYFELMAQVKGVGTVWGGIFDDCLKHVLPDLPFRLGIPETHKVGYAMMFGYPAVTYQRTVQRGPAVVNRVAASCF